MSLYQIKSLVVILGLCVAFTSSCTTYKLSRALLQPTEIHQLPPDLPFLKAHMKNGDLYIFSSWSVPDSSKTLSGMAKHYNPERQLLRTDSVTIFHADISILETNELKLVPKLAPLAVIGVLSATVTIACLANPKACFGSCPTFFVNDADSGIIQSEGFSASISPSLEDTDIDALYYIQPQEGIFHLRMTNEALETHAIRSLNVLAAPVRAGERVCQTEAGSFYSVANSNLPLSATGSEGDCRTQLLAADRDERISLSDESDLATRETLDLTFKAEPGENGLGFIISARQTLLSTFLFYQTLSFMGKRAGEWLALLERGDDRVLKKVNSMGEALGGIELLGKNTAGKWVVIEEINETGPLAIDTKLIVLPTDITADSLRLRMTKGHWRIDYCAITQIKKKVTPQLLLPSVIQYAGKANPEARKTLLDPSEHLFTYPGDEYDFYFELPEGDAKYELFLQTTGYYLEWMRGEWLREEDQQAAAHMLLKPEEALKQLAPAFKELEPEMEEIFWSSRYARKK